jgi:hypothetical protein
MIKARFAIGFIVICLAIGTFRMLRALNAVPAALPAAPAPVSAMEPTTAPAAPVPPSPPPAPEAPDPWSGVDISKLVQTYLREGFPLLDPEWKLSSKAVDALQLSPEEITKVQQILDNTRQRMRTEAQRRLVPDLRRSKGDVHAFRMKAYPREGRDIRAAMYDQVAQQIGATRGKLFHVAFSGGQFAGDFGLNELQLRVAPAEPGGAGRFEVQYEALSYEDGRRKAVGKVPLENLERELGLKLAIAVE